MNKEIYIRKCAEFMGYSLIAGFACNKDRLRISQWECGTYNPYDNMNQLAEVVDKALKESIIIAGRVEKLSLQHIMEVGTRKALTDFVEECIK